MKICLETTCRICLNSNACINIFPGETFNKSTKIENQEMLNSLVSFKAIKDDGLPPKICQKCKYKLSSSYKFKILAETSNKLLLKCISNPIEERVDLFDEFETKPEIKDENTQETSCGEDDYCNFSFKEESSLENSMQTSSIGVKVFKDEDDIPLSEVKSDVCLSNQNEIEISQKTGKAKYTGNKRKIKKTADNSKIYSHLKNDIIITNEKNGLKICHLCGEQTTKMALHMKKHFGVVAKLLPCGECSKVFKSHSSRKRHRLIHHQGIRYFCEICQKHFKHRQSHIDFVHTVVEKKFECIECGKKYARKSNLQAHVLSHTDERPIPCVVCGKGFKSQKIASFHKRSVHDKEKNHICQYCSKGFFYSNDLKQHIRSHTKEKIYKCKECDKSFTTSSILRTHLKRHAGIKNYSCDICKKNFVNIGSLRTHMISHTKVKKYSCKYCGVKFGRSDHRNRHEKNSHEIKLKFF